MDSDLSESDEFFQWLSDQGYKNLRQLGDGTIVGTLDLLFTRGLCVDLDRWGYGSRYCYEQRDMAVRACEALKSGDDTPMAGFIAERHRSGIAPPRKNESQEKVK